MQALFAHLPTDELQLAAVIGDVSRKTLLIDNPDNLMLVLQHLSMENRLAFLQKTNCLARVIQHPTLLKMLLEQIPESERLHVLCQTHQNQRTPLQSSRYQPDSFHVILETLPQYLSMALEDRKIDLKNHAQDVIASLESLQKFISQIEPFTDEKKLHTFVKALIRNENVEPSLDLLLKSATHHAFFKMTPREIILQNMHELDGYWSSRIPPMPKTDSPNKKTI